MVTVAIEEFCVAALPAGDVIEQNTVNPLLATVVALTTNVLDVFPVKAVFPDVGV